MIDVDAIDLERIDGRDRPRRGVFANASGKYLAALRRELFAIAKPADLAVRRENHGSGKHGSKESPAAHFVDTGNEAKSLGTGLTLVLAVAFHSVGAYWRSRRRAALPFRPRR